ncbi:hypothetical protein EES44_18345 [Streptomyces sp. ADI96-15]|nr:hypothetical protein EES44_18345 [Streptomyces sp. ADI96-15]
MVEGGTRGGQGAADVDARVTGVLFGVGGEPRSLVAQGRGGLCGQDPGHGPQGPTRLLCGRLFGGRCLFDDDVGVGAADAERRHPGPARPFAPGPGNGTGEQPQGSGGPVDVRGRIVGVEGARQFLVAQAQYGLHDTGGSGGGLGVPDARLHRPQVQGPFGIAPLPVCRLQCPGLDRVAQLGAGAVRLHHVHVGPVEPGVRQRRPDDLLLCGAVRGGESAAGAVLVDRRAADDGEDAVSVAAGVGEPFEAEHPGALRRPEAVGGCGEGLAPAVGGEAPLAAEPHKGAEGGHDGDTAGEGEIALALAEGAHGQVQGDEGRRAGGVHRDGGPLKSERVGDAAGQDAGGRAGHQVSLDAVGGVQGRPVVERDGADEDPGGTAPEGGGVDARPLDGFPGRFEQEALLRVHRIGLTRGDPEETGVEVTGVVQEAALPDIGASWGVRVGVVGSVGVPAPVVGEGGDGVGAVADELPEILGGGDAAGEAAGHADDGDRFVSRGLDLAQPSPGVVQVGGHPAQVAEELVIFRHQGLTWSCRGVMDRTAPSWSLRARGGTVAVSSDRIPGR